MKRTKEVDLHGFHPYDDDLGPSIRDALREAYEAGAETLRIIHGHGHHRERQRALFANTNTGFLGVTVRGILRNDRDLRRYMLAKIDVSHEGSTTVRIRPNESRGRNRAAKPE